jgi:hypothetical protein
VGSMNAATAGKHHSPLGRKNPITREQLYELVWSTPMLRVAERFGVSSSYMARVCTELQVPRPNRGYWTQHELGRPPARPVLPPLQPGDLESWTPGQSVGSNQRVALLSATPADVGVPAARRRGRPSKKATLPGIHPLLKGAKEHFLKSRDSRTGLAHPTKRLLVDIVVSPELLDQALDVANELFLALTAKGHRLVLPPLQQNLYRPKIPIREAAAPNRYYDELWAPDRPTLLFIGDQCVGLTLFETLELVETVYSSGKYIAVRDLTPQQRRQYVGPQHWTSSDHRPSGRLVLQAYCPTSQRVKWVKRWKEARSGELRSMIPRIVSDFAASLPELKEQVDVARQEEKREREKWEEERRQLEQKWKQERQQQANKAARQDLMAAISAWNEARMVEAYFSEVLRAAEHLEPQMREAVAERVKLAQALLKSTDPLELLARWKTPDERL